MDERETARQLVRERPGIAWGELVERVAESVGIDPADEEATEPIQRIVEAHMDDESWEILVGDRLVDTVALLSSAVLTHRLSRDEVESGVLDLRSDLSPFRYQGEGLRTPAGGEVTRMTESPVQAWWGPDEWLAAFEPEALVAVRVADQVVTVEAIAEPEADPALVELLRSVYEAEVDEVGLPVPLSDLVFGAVLADGAWFASPRRPVSELCEAAGLEVRGAYAADDEDVWENQVHAWRLHLVRDVVDGFDAQVAALELMEVLDGRGEGLEVAASVRALPVTELSGVASVFFDGGALATTRPLDEVAERLGGLLAGTSWRPRDEAKLRWLAAVTDERRGRPLDALVHLEAAVRVDPACVPAVDRLAWYRSDAGDADGARKLWGSVAGAGGFHPDLAVLSALPRAGDGPAGGTRPGRNDPCWCGSGRKFKVCHLGRDEAVPLADRVLWLNRKSMAFAERRGGLDEDLYALAECRAGVDADDDPEAVAEAMDDPLVVDVALVELGWFDVFLAERGPLLPDDEAELAAAWARIDRTVYEVVGVAAGASMTVRDLRSGDVTEVRERMLSRHGGAGTLLCGRAVPDGAGHQFVGALFAVPPGREARLVEILEQADGYELLEYVSSLERPPA